MRMRERVVTVGIAIGIVLAGLLIFKPYVLALMNFAYDSATTFYGSLPEPVLWFCAAAEMVSALVVLMLIRVLMPKHPDDAEKCSAR